MDVSQILLTYLAITIAWPFLVLLYEPMGRSIVESITDSLPDERWAKLFDSIGDKTIFAGLAVIVGNLFTLIEHEVSHSALPLPSFMVPTILGGINLVWFGYIIILHVSRSSEND